jgi:hypothetical protein
MRISNFLRSTQWPFNHYQQIYIAQGLLILILSVSACYHILILILQDIFPLSQFAATNIPLPMAFKSSVLITGGTSGLGYYCAKAIARQHPECQIVIASRTDPTSAAASINASLGQKNTSYLPLDLASLAQVRSFVKVWESQKFPPIRTLLLSMSYSIP